uniref:Uncharacterized protein n=1 Tax=Arundo donax TaxID=35708 RepID=A0A0A8Y5C5_ARUDO
MCDVSTISYLNYIEPLFSII